MRKYLSFALKGIIFISALLGVLWMILTDGQTAADGFGSLLYFTLQSNLWIGITALVLLLLGIVEQKCGYVLISEWMYVVKLVFTVSITLTGAVFCFLLAPASRGAFSPWNLTDCLTHVITPVLAIIDFFVDEYPIFYNKKQVLCVLVPPVYYLGFAALCSYLKVDFGGGSNYPYFFLNFNSPMGWLGVGGEIPYPFGAFYWILMLLVLVLCFGYFYAWLNNKITKRANG